MVKCSVKFCNRNANNDMGISFFRFPAETARCDEWMRALGRPDLQGIHADKMHHSKYRVCGAHFHQNSFSSMLMNRLKKEAVPIIFPPAAGYGPFFGEDNVEENKQTEFSPGECNLPFFQC
ncbi:hypothetical protein HHI36_010202 [Cryptolaemus montrouzieri]|uniref:THAP-type domain-containing protein n=1 Tax=Cryptolaemus montrouzieri TaxID=559131 RepID=A0ABD2MI59_9CUCU